METARKPNLIFVFGDQHRQCDVGCAGNPQVQTPAMDQLAQEGMFFPNTFTNVPICVPARGCLMTGKYPLNHKAVSNDLPLPLTETGIAEVFKEAEYATGYIGKWHLGGMPRDKFITPEMRFGFDHWIGWNCHHNYFNAPYHDSDGNQMQIEGYEPEFQTDQAIQYCRDHVDEPFCLYMSWGPPHNPYEHVPERYKEMYPPDQIQLRPNATDTPATRKDISGYYAHITALDENLARLMTALDELGIADDTILVYTSDHGDMLGSHGHVRKERPWEESARIPFMIRWPRRIPAGVTRDTLLSQIIQLIGVTSARRIRIDRHIVFGQPPVDQHLHAGQATCRFPDIECCGRRQTIDVCGILPRNGSRVQLLVVSARAQKLQHHIVEHRGLRKISHLPTRRLCLLPG